MTENKKEKVFANGIYFNEKHQNAPNFVLGKLAINKERLIEWLNSGVAQPNEKGYIYLDILMGKESGKPFIEVNDWKPDPAKAGQNGPEHQNNEKSSQGATQPATEPNTDMSDISADSIPF